MTALLLKWFLFLPLIAACLYVGIRHARRGDDGWAAFMFAVALINLTTVIYLRGGAS